MKLVTTITALLVVCCSASGILPILTETSVVHASDSLRTVALTGDPAPVPNEDAVFGEQFGSGAFGPPVINNRGQTAFQAVIPMEVDNPPFGTGIVDLSSIILENDTDDLTLVAIQGDPMPGTSGTEIFGDFEQPALNDSGQVAFASGFDGVFLYSNAVLQPTVLERNPTPIPGKELAIFSRNPTFNNLGQTAFRSALVNPGATRGSGSGIFLSKPSSSELMPVVLKGDTVPVPSGDVNLISFPNLVDGYPLNDKGQVAFYGELTGTDDAILRGDGSDLELFARRGDPVPGTNAFFTALSSPTLNNQGHLAFASTVSGEISGRVIFSEGLGEGLALVAREGDPAPVQSADAKFGRSFGPYLLNKQGELVFRATLTGENVDDTNDEALFRHNADGIVELIARRGDPAPVPDNDVNFGWTAALDFRAFSINGRGQIALTAPLSDGTWAILAEDVMGDFQVIARTGGLIDVSDDPLVQDLREIRDFRFTTGSGNEDGRRSGFNDLGQLTFLAMFTDDTQGIFVSSLVAVPEPTAIALALITTLSFLLRRQPTQLGGRAPRGSP